MTWTNIVNFLLKFRERRCWIYTDASAAAPFVVDYSGPYHLCAACCLLSFMGQFTPQLSRCFFGFFVFG